MLKVEGFIWKNQKNKKQKTKNKKQKTKKKKKEKTKRGSQEGKSKKKLVNLKNSPQTLHQLHFDPLCLKCQN